MIETTIRDPEKHETLRADSQGRINLGIQYAGRIVEVVVAESREEESERIGLQQVIGDRPMEAHERQGMLFVRLFGIDPAFLTDDHSAVVTDGEVRPKTVSLSDVDWSKGYLLDHENVSRFEFDRDSESQFPFGDELTAEPVGVSRGNGNYDESVYCFENEDGGLSAVSKAFVEYVQRVFGYDPTDDFSNVRVHPEEAPRPVMFRDPESDRYVAIAPIVAE